MPRRSAKQIAAQRKAARVSAEKRKAQAAHALRETTWNRSHANYGDYGLRERANKAYHLHQGIAAGAKPSGKRAAINARHAANVESLKRPMTNFETGGGMNIPKAHKAKTLRGTRII